MSMAFAGSVQNNELVMKAAAHALNFLSPWGVQWVHRIDFEVLEVPQFACDLQSAAWGKLDAICNLGLTQPREAWSRLNFIRVDRRVRANPPPNSGAIAYPCIRLPPVRSGLHFHPDGEGLAFLIRLEQPCPISAPDRTNSDSQPPPSSPPPAPPQHPDDLVQDRIANATR